MLGEIVVGLMVALVAYFYVKYTRKYGVLEASGVPYQKPFLCFGSGPWGFHKYVMHELDLKRLMDAKTLSLGIYEGTQPVILTIDPEILKEIHVKQAEKFIDKPDFAIDKQYSTLDIVNGEEWQFLRRNLTPTLTSGKIKFIMKAAEEVTDNAVEYIKNKCDKDGVCKHDIKKILGAITLEVILKSSYGITKKIIEKDRLDTDQEAVRRIEVMLNEMVPTSAFESFFWNLFLFEPALGKAMAASFIDGMKYFNQLVKAMIMKRKADGNGDSEDFLGKLTKIYDQVSERNQVPAELTESMVLSQGSAFLLAGYSTTAYTLTLICYYLSIHQDIQERCVDNVRSTVNDAIEINYETVGEMKYLEAVILETLRMSPLLLRNQRICLKDTEIKGIKFKKGVRVDVPSYAMHHHPEFYDDPDEFNPNRFISGGKSLHDISFQAFGCGPRICLGSRLALQEMKLIMAKLLYHFKLQENPAAKIDYLKGNIFMNLPKDIQGIFQLRE